MCNFADLSYNKIWAFHWKLYWQMWYISIEILLLLMLFDALPCWSKWWLISSATDPSNAHGREYPDESRCVTIRTEGLFWLHSVLFQYKDHFACIGNLITNIRRSWYSLIYIYNGCSYTSEKIYLYWDSSLIPKQMDVCMMLPVLVNKR